MANDGHDLVAVLDWGLGHASRCVPVIEQLIDAGQEVTIASSGKALHFLRRHFPAADYLELPAYEVRYPFRSMALNLLWQAPRILYTIWREHRLIRQLVRQGEVQRIISDGRFGCWYPRVESIWLAHQLHIQHNNSVLAKGVNTCYHAYIRRGFQSVWVPDRETEPRLAGRLSRPIPGLPHQYIGPRSRYAGISLDTTNQTSYHYLALLSGPEPQRSYLEQQIRAELSKLHQPCLLIRGVPGETTIKNTSGLLHEVDWLLGDELLKAVQQSRQIICRSGYSTLMDAWYWQKPLLLIPTPGQTEQGYLARYWAEQAWADWQEQDQFNIVSSSDLD